MNWRDRISVNPKICHGAACIKGTRVMVSVVIDTLAEGETPESVAAAYSITVEDVRAALQYAAEMTRERIVSLPADAS